MSVPEIERDMKGITTAIALCEEALALCDKHGFIFAAIDVSSALDKLKALKVAAQT